MLGSRQITTMQLWAAKAIAQNNNIISPAIDLREIVGLWKFSLHAIIAGPGQVNIAVLTCSVKDGTYVEDSTLIADDQTAGTVHA